MLQVYILERRSIGTREEERRTKQKDFLILAALFPCDVIYDANLRLTGLESAPRSGHYIAISALFLLSVSNNVHAWHMA